MKQKIKIIFKFILLITLFCSGNSAYGIQIPFLWKKAAKILNTDLKTIFRNLRINPKKLTDNEIRFIENSLNESSLWMIETNRNARRAVLEGPSSYVEQVYRRIFFSRLNPRDQEAMSEFFDYLSDHKTDIFEANNGIGRQDNIHAWEETTKGTVDAIKNGDFNISISDLHALYVNYISDGIKLGRYPKPETSSDYQATMTIIWDFFQGTLGLYDIDLNPLSIVMGITRNVEAKLGDPGEVRRVISQLKREELEFLDIQDRMFLSPFYRPSNDVFFSNFLITMTRYQHLFNKDMILKMWPGNKKAQSFIQEHLRSIIRLAKTQDGDFHRNLRKYTHYRAILKASRENQGIRIMVENQFQLQGLSL